MPLDMKMAARFAATKVLVVDDEYYMRKVVRTLLMSIGVNNVIEAENGHDGLEQIRRNKPDIVIVDWQMPQLDGPGFVRMVRSPGSFCTPDIPIIMLTGHSERSKVVEAIQLGVNEFLLKPVSAKALEERLVSVLAKPRPIIETGNYYGPEPRNLMQNVHADNDSTIALLD